MLGGVKASTPAARSLLDPACAPGGHVRRSAPRNGPSVSPRNTFEKDALSTFGEGPARRHLKFRDQKPPKTRRFACSGSRGGGHENTENGEDQREDATHVSNPVERARKSCPTEADLQPEARAPSAAAQRLQPPLHDRTDRPIALYQKAVIVTLSADRLASDLAIDACPVLECRYPAGSFAEQHLDALAVGYHFLPGRVGFPVRKLSPQICARLFQASREICDLLRVHEFLVLILARMLGRS